VVFFFEKNISQIFQENLLPPQDTTDFFEKSEKSFFQKKYASDFLGKSEVSFLDLSNKIYFSGSKKPP